LPARRKRKKRKGRLFAFMYRKEKNKNRFDLKRGKKERRVQIMTGGRRENGISP